MQTWVLPMIPEVGTFFVDWTLYKILYNEAQKHEGAELTMGPAPETGDSRRRSDAIMSGSCSWGLDMGLYLPVLASVRSELPSAQFRWDVGS